MYYSLLECMWRWIEIYSLRINPVLYYMNRADCYKALKKLIYASLKGNMAIL